MTAFATIPDEPVAVAAADAAYAARAEQRVRARHIEMLVLAGIVIVLTFALTVRDDGRVAFRFFERFPVPETCLSKSMFHVECPGCGLTRSFIELSRGHLAASLRYHRVGWLIALAVLGQVPYRIACMRRRRAVFGEAFPRYFGYVLIVSLLLNWLLGLPWRH